MTKYEVILTRSYAVTVEAEDSRQAAWASELYLGNCSDLSTATDREEHSFQIHEIEMGYNEAIEVKETQTSGAEAG